MMDINIPEVAAEVEKAFAMLEEARKNQPVVELIPTAVEALRRFPAEATKERLRKLEDWANAGLQTESDVQQIKLLLAEIYDLEGRYSEVAKIYREVLANKDATATSIPPPTPISAPTQPGNAASLNPIPPRAAREPARTGDGWSSTPATALTPFS